MIKQSHLGHAEEDDLVSQHILIVKVGSLCYLCPLEIMTIPPHASLYLVHVVPYPEVP